MSQLATVEKTLFNYLELSPEDREWLRQQEDSLRQFSRRMVMDSLTIGKVLNEVRERIRRGSRFRAWLQCNTAFSDRTASRLRDLAKWFAPYAEVIQAHQDSIDLCALHELSEPSVHPDSRAAAISHLTEKHALPRAIASELIAKHKPAPKAKPALFAKECEEPPPAPTPTARVLADIEELCRTTTILNFGTIDDAEDGDDVIYFGRAHFSDEGAAPRHRVGKSLAEVVEQLTGRVPTKPCTMCGTVKPLTAFTEKKAHKDGRASECKTCSRERVNAAKQDKKERDAA